jgi:hypothetical protein
MRWVFPLNLDVGVGRGGFELYMKVHTPVHQVRLNNQSAVISG